MPEWELKEQKPINGDQPSTEVLLSAERQMVEYLEESIRDLESLYREDIGWLKMGLEAEIEFSPDGRKKIAELARIMAAANPLINNGLQLRCGYIWGQGCQISIKDSGADGSQDVNGVWETFWDDPLNTEAFCSPDAQVGLERQLGTDGDIFLSLPTEPITGRVRVRNIPPEEIDRFVSNPEDSEDVWLYRRNWTKIVDRQDGTTDRVPMITWHPRLGYRPAVRARTWGKDLGGKPAEIRWDAPMKHIAVNKIRVGARQRGLGDLFPALPWARLDKEFLENRSIYMKAMTRILWQYVTKSSKVKRTADRIRTQQAAPGEPGNPEQVGQSIITGPDTSIEAVNKSGAQIDAESHKPLASYVAAALGIPLTWLLGDPGQTGARAVAETLTEPNENRFQMRRNMWTGVIGEIAGYVIDSAVIAPAGQLRGTVTRDGNRLVVTLPPVDSREVEVAWPEWDSTPIDVLMKAISLADSTDKMPPLVVVRLLLQAFEVEDIDEVIASITDANGNWIPQEVRDQEVFSRQQDRGEI